MSYWSDWYDGTLQKCEITRVYVGTRYGFFIENDISTSNNNYIVGSDESLFNALSQDTLQLEVYNGDNKYDIDQFSKEQIAITVTVDNDEEDTTSFEYRGIIDLATVNNDYITLNIILNQSINKGKKNWASMVSGSDTPNLETIFNNECTAINTGATSITSFYNYDTPYPTNENFNKEYQTSAWGEIKTNGELLNQIAQLLGGYVYIDKESNTHIGHFPKTVLNRENYAYRYGGCFDYSEVIEGDLTLEPHTYSEAINTTNYQRLVVTGGDRSDRPIQIYTNAGELVNISDNYDNGTAIDISTYTSIMFIWGYGGTQTLDITYSLIETYSTGDNVDGNTDTLYGGTFTNDFIVINDSVLEDLTLSDGYEPTGVRATIPVWSNDGTAEDKEYQVGTSGTLVDITSNNMLKLANARSGTLNYSGILNAILDEIDFKSYGFEATVLNNLDFKLGDAVAICSGVGPTRYSYIEDINTDIFGATIISNSRGE